jgi:hypothetical protein
MVTDLRGPARRLQSELNVLAGGRPAGRDSD